MPYLCLSLAMVIVGSSVVAGKIMTQEMPVFLASALRFVLALIVLVPWLYVREGGLPRLSRRSLMLLALQALFGSFLFTAFLLYGLRHTTPASAGIITSTTPACIGIIAWVFLKERPGPRVVLGIAFSVMGVAAINLVSAQASPAGPHPILGNGLVMGAVVFESLFLLLRKTVREPLSPIAAATLISFFGLAWFLVPGIIEAAHFPLTGISPAGWLSVAYYGVFITVLAYIFWFAGITRVSASVAGVFTAVMPVSALTLSALILDEPLGLPHVAGCALVLLGIACISGLRLGRARQIRQGEG